MIAPTILVLLLALLVVPSAAAPRPPDPKKEALRQQKLPEDAPADFASLRKRADARAAGQDSAFRLFQVETELEGATLRITGAHFRYFQPARGEWEQLDVNVSTGGRIRMGKTLGRAYPGSIGGARTTFTEPRPIAAPARLVAPEDAVRQLGRGPLTGPFGAHGRASEYLRDQSQWRLVVVLLHTGAQHQIGHVELSPLRDHVPWPRRRVQPSQDDTFFQKTAPAGAWVWWTVLQDREASTTRFEYVYMDAATGKATSACADGAGRFQEGTWTAAACARR